MQIYLLRHGHTTQAGTYTGSSEVELSSEGREQVKKLSSFLRSIDFDHCFSSPLVRCRQTLSILAIGTEISYQESLREIDFGNWEGLTFEQILNSFPNQREEWLAKAKPSDSRRVK